MPSGDFMYKNGGGCTIIYIPMSYIFRSLGKSIWCIKISLLDFLQLLKRNMDNQFHNELDVVTKQQKHLTKPKLINH